MQKSFILLVFLSLIAVACGGGEDAPTEAPVAVKTKKKPAAEKKVDVKKIWKVRCIVCHGIDGTMGVNGAANLQESDKDLDYRINIIKNGSENGVMTAFGKVLSEEEIRAVAQYTIDLKRD